MRTSSFATLIMALGLSVAGATAALAEQYRGPLQSIDTARGTIRAVGVTIDANGHSIGDLNLNTSYVITWVKQGDRNLLTDIRPDTSQPK